MVSKKRRKMFAYKRKTTPRTDKILIRNSKISPGEINKDLRRVYWIMGLKLGTQLYGKGFWKHWGIPLSRRFRSLKLWFVIRKYGVEGLQKYIREHVRLAKKFESLVQKDDRFVVANQVHFGLVCFRLKGSNNLNQKLLSSINASGKLHMVPASLSGNYVIRFCVCAQHATDADIVHAWDVIMMFTEELLEIMKVDMKEEIVCNNRIVMAQRKHLDDFLRGRIIGRLKWGRTQLEVSKELRIAQSVIPRLWRRFKDDASDLSRQLSSATGTAVSRQTMYRRLGHIGLYARRPVRCVPLTATHCRLRLTWSREHVMWTPQQWSCVMFSDESRFSLQSDSRRTLVWRAPGTRYHQENTIERHRYGGAGWLVWGGIILGSRTDLHVQSVKMTGPIYRDVILEQHVRLLPGAMGAEFLFMDNNFHPHRANIVDECLQSEDITRMDWPAYSLDLNPIEHVWDMFGRRIAARQPPPTCLPELRRALLDEWCNIPQDQIDNLILSMPRRCKACVASSGRHTPY
ncbi:tyrosine decarboxylase [Trichonephila clavipes]|nr:tyrosine decarboxylase [Trichonephila clavipes]